MQNAITLVVNNCIEKGKNVFYLVLKRKIYEKQIIDDLENELDLKMQEFLNDILPKLENAKFDNPEKSLRYILVKGLINILKKMVEENIGQLSEEDQKLIEDIMNNDDKNNQNKNDIQNNEGSPKPKDK